MNTAMNRPATKITRVRDALAARHDPEAKKAADAYFARRNARAARSAGRPLLTTGHTAKMGRSA